MELKLVDSKSVSLSEIALLRTKHLAPVSDFRRILRVGFSSKFSSRNGLITRASYSSTSNGTIVSKKVISPIEREKVVAEDYFVEINGRNNGGSSSMLTTAKMGVLEAWDDEYGGVVVDPNCLPDNPDAFASILHLSLSHWKTKGKKGVWLKLPLERSELVPSAAKAGFEYHHAEREYVMMTYWIPEGPCLLPENASYQVGVGGFVVNDKNEVLVVQEKFCAPSFFDLWKIPTGFINESEEIYNGAVREVKEETGVDTEFVEVMAFRHAHNVAFEKSDLFFVCLLKPLSTQISHDDYEIQAAKWMPLVEFVEQPLIQSDKMFKKIIDICIARMGKRYCGLSAHQVVSKFDGKQSCLYYNVVDDSQNANCAGH